MPREDILVPRSSQREMHSDDVKIDQRAPLPDDLADREGEVVLADKDIANADYLADLAFMEEPVLIRLEPSSDRNAVSVFWVAVNGREAEILVNGQWRPVGWLPVGEAITIRRKYLEVIIRAKIDTIVTPDMETAGLHPDNTPRRITSAVHSFSVIEDRNPRGAVWMAEMRRRNF